MERRAFLRSIAALSALPLAAPLVTGCTPARGITGTVRIGVMSNLTHAPMLTALATGAIQRALPGLKIEVRTFRVGPRVTEALLGNAIDIATAGPAALVSMHARHPHALSLLSGVSSGGASFVTLPSITRAEDLHGARVASPQIGTTQDVSLRKWLAAHGVVPKEKGGDVIVDALASADVMAQMRRGALAGAWLQEPWATRIVEELGAKRFLDERDIWPRHRFPTSMLTARRAFVDARGDEASAITAAVRAEIDRATAEPAAVRDLAMAEIKRLTGKGLPKKVVDAAWARVDFLRDPLLEELATFARDARELGYVPTDDVRGLVA